MKSVWETNLYWSDQPIKVTTLTTNLVQVTNSLGWTNQII